MKYNPKKLQEAILTLSVGINNPDSIEYEALKVIFPVIMYVIKNGLKEKGKHANIKRRIIKS